MGNSVTRSYWDSYLENANGLMLVIDSADRLRLSELREEFKQLLENNKLWWNLALIFANKQDLLHAVSVDEISDAMNLHLTRQLYLTSC